MTKRLLLLAACVAALSVPVAVAQAATKHKVSDTVDARVLTANTKLIVYTGTVTDKTRGPGAVVTRSTPSGTAGRVNQQVVAFYKSGSITFKGFTNAKANADGSTAYTGSVSAVGGTNKFKGVKGTVKLVGSAPADDPTHATFKVTGSLTY